MVRRVAARPSLALYYGARTRALAAGAAFALVEADVAAMLAASAVCAYCDAPLRRSRSSGGGPFSPTLDRIFPDYGYTPENTVVACHRCNALKGGHTPDTLRRLAERIIALLSGAQSNT